MNLDLFTPLFTSKNIAILIVIIIVFLVIGLLPDNPTLHKILDRDTKVVNLISGVSITLGAIGLVFTYLSRQDTEKINQYNAINGVMMRYSSILSDLLKIEENKVDDDSIRRLILLQYYNLSEEQLYYIGKKIIPQGIDEIWIRGISEQIKSFSDLEDQLKDDRGKIMDEYVRGLIVEDTYPLLYLLWQNLVKKSDIKTIKELISQKVNLLQSQNS